jgi:TonB family protein
LCILAICLFLLKGQTAKQPDKKLTWIELEPKPIKNTPDDKKERNKIVQTDTGEKVKQPKEDAFLGWQNQVVDRETVSSRKQVTIGAQGGAPKKSHADRETPEPVKSLSQLGLPILPLMKREQKDEPQWATPGTRPEDYVAGMKESDRTALNTKEYLFYGYFQRIRERLDRAWIPILRQKIVAYYNSGRQLASDMNHTTQVVVVLNDKGEITKVQLLSTSGTQDLDDAAIDAFNKAGPFPNPPKTMIDANREIRVPWDFIIKT